MTIRIPFGLRLGVFAALLFSASSCLDGPTAPLQPGVVIVTPEAISLLPLDSTLLGARVESANGRNIETPLLSWQSLDTSIAEVTSAGLVTARLHTGSAARYTAVVVSALNARADTVPVEVRPWPVARVVAGIDSITLSPEQSDTLVARPEAMNGTALTGRSFLWLASDTSVIGVNQGGVVTAKSYTGALRRRASVVVYSEGVADTIAVGVTPLQASSVQITTDSTSVLPGEEASLAATVRAGSVVLSGVPLSWSSSDTTVATVNADGVILARFYVGPSQRSTRVSASVGAVSDSTVIVVRPHPVHSVTVFPASETLTPNRTVQVDAVLRARNDLFLTDRAIVWVSSDTSVATVSENGLVLTRRAGQASITAQSGPASAQMQLTVVHPVTDVRVTPRLSTIWIGRTQAFAATLTDSLNRLLSDRLVTWTSSDTTRAVVTASGIVTARSEGLVTITAAAEGVSHSARVDLYPEPTAAITITFDDAWRGVLQYAAPILDSLRLRANAGWLTNVDWSGVMVPEELRILQASGWSILSHSMTHPYLTRLSADSASREMTQSRERIASLGFDPRVLIVPYLDHNDEVLATAAAAGYSYTRCCAQDVWSTDTLVAWPIRSEARHRLAGVDVTNYEGRVTTYNFHTAEGRSALRALLLNVVAQRKFIDVFFHDIVAADADDLRETLAILAEFRPYLITYGMLP